MHIAFSATRNHKTNQLEICNEHQFRSAKTCYIQPVFVEFPPTGRGRSNFLGNIGQPGEPDGGVRWISFRAV